MKKGSPLFSVLKLRCPECHDGKLFEQKVYDLKRVGQMRKNCPNCKVKFSKEPGFYFGAAYVSYGLSVVFGVTLFLIGYAVKQLFWEDLSYYSILGFLIFGLVVLFPLSFALSRSIWLNIFFQYKGKKV
jgi:uncharacterized protein (DUF983 family)